MNDRSAWHSPTLGEEATVLVVENCDTPVQNSPQVALSDTPRQQGVRLTVELWGNAWQITAQANRRGGGAAAPV